MTTVDPWQRDPIWGPLQFMYGSEGRPWAQPQDQRIAPAPEPRPQARLHAHHPVTRINRAERLG